MAGEYVPVAVERLVVERAGGRCEYCRSPEAFALDAFEMEHIIPRSSGGATDAGNLAFSCGGCNSFKGSRTADSDPQSGVTAPLFHPRNQRWSDHFRWSDDFLSVEGLTPTGRATVESLRLNRAPVRNLRWLLVTQGLHPPSDE